MDSKTMVFTDSEESYSYLTKQPATHICPKCERTNEGGGIVIVGNGGSMENSTSHCMWCYQDWLRANIPMVERIKPA